jgi:hypothetical protein
MYLFTYIFHRFTYTFWRTQAHICVPLPYVLRYSSALHMHSTALDRIFVIYSSNTFWRCTLHSTVLKPYIYFHAYMHAIKHLLLGLCDSGLVYHVSLYIYILVIPHSRAYFLPHSRAYLQYILVIHSSVLHILGRA